MKNVNKKKSGNKGNKTLSEKSGNINKEIISPTNEDDKVKDKTESDKAVIDKTVSEKTVLDKTEANTEEAVKVEIDKAESNKKEAVKDVVEAIDSSEKEDKVFKNKDKKITFIIAAAIIIILAGVSLFVIKNKLKGSSKHNMIRVDAKEATIFQKGSIDCWYCIDCDKYFADEKGTKELIPDEVEIYAYGKDANGVIKYDEDGQLYYLTDGVVDTSYNDFVEYEHEWYHIKDGTANIHFTGIEYGSVYDDKNWWYVENGKVRFINTIAENEEGLWYVRHGKVVFVNDIVEANGEKWLVTNGKIDPEISGTYNVDGVLYDVVNGKVESEKKIGSVDDLQPKDYYLDESGKGNKLSPSGEDTILKALKSFYKKTGIRPFLLMIDELPEVPMSEYIEAKFAELSLEGKTVLIIYSIGEDHLWVGTGTGAIKPYSKDVELIEDTFVDFKRSDDLYSDLAKVINASEAKIVKSRSGLELPDTASPSDGKKTTR
ncbi:hypothetical protein [Eubacterium ruminantium]|uniref:hypothetical protein n=1 Tax=Eubacterium ruminantium TaxID=42322 RepID=UPI00156A3145|nr:hypothetical protein [Eubacterium ruminantium]